MELSTCGREVHMPDGYTRIGASQFRSLNLRLLFADTDPDLEQELTQAGLDVEKAGYCEWVGGDSSAITVGWDWFFPRSNPVPMIAPGRIGTNVMLLGEGGYDLGPDVSNTLMTEILRSHPCQVTLSSHLKQL
jgi:hypothetical protein